MLAFVLSLLWQVQLLAESGVEICESNGAVCLGTRIHGKRIAHPPRTVKWRDEIASIEELFNFTEPVQIQGFATDALRAAQHAWNESMVSNELRGRLLTSRTSTRPTLRFRNQDNFDLPGFGSRIKLTQHAYDAWVLENKSLDEILHPGPGLVRASKIDNPDVVDVGHPIGEDALVKLVNEACYNGTCSLEGGYFKLATGLWLASSGLGWQLHFDEEHTIVFHLSGVKTFVMVSPKMVLEHSYLSPFLHPAHRHSQLHWSTTSPLFNLSGFSGSGSAGVLVPQADMRLDYPFEREIHAVLQPGDMLFIPKCWGHHTVTSPEGPSISFATVWSKHGEDTDLLEDELHLTMSSFIEQVMRTSPKTAMDYWATIRKGARLLVLLALGSETSSFWNLWLTQRWQLQFKEWGLTVGDAPSELPEEFCKSPSSPDLAEGPKNELSKILKVLQQISRRRGPALERLILRTYVGNVLDMLPFFAFADQTLFKYRHIDRSHSAVLVASFLLRSLSGCRGQEPKVAKRSVVEEMKRFQAFVEKRERESDDKEDVKRLKALVEQIENEKKKNKKKEMIFKATTIMDAWTNGAFGATN